MPYYTVWIQQENGRGPTHISGGEADNCGEAAENARQQCAADWGWDEIRAAAMLRVLGIAEGRCNIIEWNDVDD